MEISCDHLSLRKVIKNDEELLYTWANDPVVRSWSFNKDPITLDEHKLWFMKKFENPNVIIWILEISSIPSGLVRLEKTDKEVILNFLIAPLVRGRGLATKMLVMAVNNINKYWKDDKVLAYTLPENIASIKSLERAGFCLHKSDNERNCYVYNKSEKIAFGTNK